MTTPAAVRPEAPRRWPVWLLTALACGAALTYWSRRDQKTDAAPTASPAVRAAPGAESSSPIQSGSQEETVLSATTVSAPSLVTAPADPVPAFPDCPESTPANQEPCSVAQASAQLKCGYDMGAMKLSCDCAGARPGESRWRCQVDDAEPSVASCPASKPSDKSSCALGGSTCFYGEPGHEADVCHCQASRGAWVCLPGSQWMELRLN